MYDTIRTKGSRNRSCERDRGGRSKRSESMESRRREEKKDKFGERGKSTPFKFQSSTWTSCHPSEPLENGIII